MRKIFLFASLITFTAYIAQPIFAEKAEHNPTSLPQEATDPQHQDESDTKHNNLKEGLKKAIKKDSIDKVSYERIQPEREVRQRVRE